MANKEYSDELTGIISKNDYKKEDKHPDARGRCCIGGLWYWIAGWNKQSGDRRFTSLSFTLMTQGEVDVMNEKRAAKSAPQQPQQQAAPQQQAQAPQASQSTTAQQPPMDFDDDIPF